MPLAATCPTCGRPEALLKPYEGKPDHFLCGRCQRAVPGLTKAGAALLFQELTYEDCLERVRYLDRLEDEE